jgi:AcrR family transcriptional regulator
VPAAVTTRDATRSRAAILDAAEELFAERGFGGVSLGEVAAAAGLSRATPSYFFGSKEGVYRAVLERVFAERNAAVREAFAPVIDWAGGDTPAAGLREALNRAVGGYLAFLLERPAFVRLLQWEGLAGGEHLAAAPRDSRAIAEALEAVHQRLPGFDVQDALLIVVSLTFSPLTQRSTFLAALGRDPDDPAARERHVALVVDQLLHLVEGPRR